MRVSVTEIISSSSPLLEGHRAVFRCIIGLEMARVESVNWILNSIQLQNGENMRITIVPEYQRNDGHRRWSTLVFDRMHYSDTGRTYGKQFVF